jgi:hypothetical protein
VLDAGDAHQTVFDGADTGGAVDTRHGEVGLPEPATEIAARKTNLLSRGRAIEGPVGIDRWRAAAHLIAL